MACFQIEIFGVMFVLIVTVCLIFLPTEAAGACSEDSDCLNGGNCSVVEGEDNTCSCGGYFGETCSDACEADDDCGTNGTCNTGDTPVTCTCTAGHAGDQCAAAPECDADTDCEEDDNEMCNKAAGQYKCDCKSGYTREADKCKESGSALVQVSLVSLMMSLIVSAL